jgi:apolipoprotein N-acyltransferase
MRLVAAAVSGLLVAGLFPPFHFSAMVWVAMMPLVWALSSVEGKRAGWKGFGIAYLGGAVSCLIQFNWLATVSWLGAILLPLYLAIYWGLFGAFAATLGKPGKTAGPGTSLRIAFGLGAVWAGLEWLRGWLLTGFGWNALGVAFHETPVMAQGADLLGASGLSLALVAFQSIVVIAAREVILEKSRKRWDLGIVALGVLAMFLYGKQRIAAEAKAESIRLKALLVQLNIPQEAGRQLWDSFQIHQAYEEETLKALAGLKPGDARWPDWVVWPEVAMTGWVLTTADGKSGQWQNNVDSISQVRAAGPFSLIYGVNEEEAEKDGDLLISKEGGKVYNSVAVVSPEGVLKTYRKRHLVIFGETIPFMDKLPWLKQIYEQQSGTSFNGGFSPGESLETLPIRVGETTVGAIPTICFEDSVPRLTRKFVRSGPQMILNVTNDGWFKQSPAAAQHFATARFRAIELRRPMVRCANTGVSAAIDSTGTATHVLVDEKGSHFTRGALFAEVKIPLKPSFSLYALIGDWGILTLAATGFGISILARKSRELDSPAASANL